MPRGQGGTLSGFTPLSTPNAPTDLSVNAGIGSASVSFTAPSDTGDAAVTSYIVTAVDESTGVSSGTVGTESPINISLSAGTFKIRAQAVNGFGPGRLTEFNTGNVISFSGAQLYAWGDNGDGRLGDTTTDSRSSPTQIGFLTNWSQLSGANRNTLATKTDNTLWGWGYNGQGQLGNNDVNATSSPVQVGALSVWYQVSAGRNHAGAVKTNNTLWTWGYNNNGELGDNTVVRRSSPVQIGALTNWSQVSSGRNHKAAVKTDGTMWSWGNNNRGQLGDNTTVNKSSPVQVGALTNWLKVSLPSEALRYRAAAVKTNGTAWGWGLNSAGGIGDNTTITRSSPVQVGALTNWDSISAGGYHTAAVKTNGTLWSWGFNGAGQLGDNTVLQKSSPVQIGASTSWISVSCGSDHTVATLGVT
jgi:alpha-tubulin suppressor-like RCC1 family protein